jgi:hypothetical protein
VEGETALAFLGLELRANPVAVDLVRVVDGRGVEIVKAEVFPPKPEHLGFAPGTHSGQPEDRGPRLGSGCERLGEFVALVDARLWRLADAGALSAVEELGRTDPLPVLAPLGVAEDLGDGAEDLRDRPLGVALCAQLSDELGDIVRPDRVELSPCPSRLEVLVDVVGVRLAVFLPSAAIGPARHSSATGPKRSLASDWIGSPESRAARMAFRNLRAAVIPPRTVIQRSVPLASRAPISSVPSNRR